MISRTEEGTLPPMSSGAEQYPHHQLMQPQLVCDACGRPASTGTEWHSITDPDPAACAAGDGAGYWVCHECHKVIHDWIQANPDHPQPAKEGFHQIYKRLRLIVEEPARKYRRHSKRDRGEQGDELANGDH